LLSGVQIDRDDLQTRPCQFDCDKSLASAHIERGAVQNRPGRDDEVRGCHAVVATTPIVQLPCVEGFHSPMSIQLGLPNSARMITISACSSRRRALAATFGPAAEPPNDDDALPRRLFRLPVPANHVQIPSIARFVSEAMIRH
jgi:hypothetical protein